MNPPSVSKPALPRQILVAVDAGPLSDHAIEAAVDLSRRCDAGIELVHAFGAPNAAWTLEPDPRDVARGTDDLSRATECVQRHLAALDASADGPRPPREALHVLPGRPAKVILERARRTSADLIVLGALRRRSVLDIGSTARAILAGANCPVWVQPGPYKEIGRILVPVDLSRESLVALGMACQLARKFRARVSPLHVFEIAGFAAVPWDGYWAYSDIETAREASRKDFEQALREFPWDGIDHDDTFTDGRAADEILDRARSADLVVMGTHGRTGFASALLGSVAYEVLVRTTRPVMVVRAPGRKFET